MALKIFLEAKWKQLRCAAVATSQCGGKECVVRGDGVRFVYLGIFPPFMSADCWSGNMYKEDGEDYQGLQVRLY